MKLLKPIGLVAVLFALSACAAASEDVPTLVPTASLPTPTANAAPTGGTPTSNNSDLILLERYNAVSGKNAQLHEVCFLQSISFEDVVMVGQYTDAGCAGTQVLVRDVLGEAATLSGDALTLYGWNETNNRETLALQWSQEVLFAWQAIVTYEIEDFTAAGYEYVPPRALLQPDGGVNVELWVEALGDTSEAATYIHTLVLFSGDGFVSNIVPLESFQADTPTE